MKYALIQISEPYLSRINVITPCFRMYGIFETLEDAIKAREETKHVDWFIIIQAW